MSPSWKILIALLAVVLCVAVFGIGIYPLMFFNEAPTTTTTTTSEPTANASQGFEVSPGTSSTLQIGIDSQNFFVKASNNVFQLFGVKLAAPAVSFTDAGKIAYKSADLNILNEIDLNYANNNMVYTVTGYAKDNFYGFSVENLRIVRVSDTGDVLSTTKELLFVSFVKNLVSSTFGLWQH